MITALILCVASQCGPGGCPAPSRGGMSFRMPYAPSHAPYVMPAQLQSYRPYVPQSDQVPTPKYDWHGTKYNGLAFKVWGFINSAGLVEWSIDLKENKASYWAAQAAHDKQKTEKPVEQPKADAIVNYGVDPTKIPHGERYTVNSAEAQDFVVMAPMNPQSPDGRDDKIYLTVIGAPGDRYKIAKDWKDLPAFAEWHDKVWFQEFARGDWQVKDELGYDARGKPTILVQNARGGVVLREQSYSGPQPILAALRRADPNYRPNDDPGPDGSADEEPSHGHRVVLVILMIAVLALLFIPRKRS